MKSSVAQIKKLERLLNTTAEERKKRKIAEPDFKYWQGVKKGVTQAIYAAGFVIYETRNNGEKKYYIL